MSLLSAVDTCAIRTSVCRLGNEFSSRNKTAHNGDVKTPNRQ